MKLYEEFIKLQSLYSKLTEDKLEEGFSKDILAEKEMLNSRDKRKIKSAVRSFNITKTSIELKLESILNNLELVKVIDKTYKILKGFSNLDDQNKEVYDVKKTAVFLIKILSLYRLGISISINNKAKQIRSLTETLLGFNDYFSDDIKISDDTKDDILSFLSGVNEIPDMVPDYNIDYELFSSKSEIAREYAKKSEITENIIRDLLGKIESLEESISSAYDGETNDEVLFVKRKVHPKTIYISKENLAELSNSMQTIDNIERLVSELDGIYFTNEHGYEIKPFNAILEEMRTKLISVLASQNTLSDKISADQDEIYEILDEALLFVNSYEEKQKFGGQKL